MGFTTRLVLVINPDSKSLLSAPALQDALADVGELDSCSGSTEVIHLDFYEDLVGSRLELDHWLSGAAAYAWRSPGSSEVIILVAGDPNPAAMAEVRAALHHLRTDDRTWCSVYTKVGRWGKVSV